MKAVLTVAKEKKQVIAKIVVAVVSVLIILLSIIVMGATFIKAHVSILEIFKIGFVLLFHIMLPGYLVARKVDIQHLAGKIAFSFLFGYGWLVLFYFADELLIKTYGIRVSEMAADIFQKMQIPYFAVGAASGLVFARLGGLVLSVVSVFLLIKDIKEALREKRETFKVDYVLLPLAAMIFLGASISFGAIFCKVSVAPTSYRSLSAYHDVLWLIGNDAALAEGWPAEGFQYAGKALNSNIGANLVRAMISRISGLSSAKVFGYFASFFTIPFIGFSIYTLGLFWSNKRQTALFSTFAFMYISFFSFSFLHMFSGIQNAGSLAQKSYYFSVFISTLYCPNGIDMAVPTVALLAVLILYLLKQLKSSRTAYFLVSIAAFLLTIGKYVFTVCVLGSIVGSVICMGIQKRKFQQMIPFGLSFIAVLIGFLIGYFSIVRVGEVKVEASEVAPVYEEGTIVDTYEEEGYVYAHKYSSFEIGANVKNTKLFANIKEIVASPDWFDGTLAFLLSPLHYIFQLVAVSIPFAVWLLSKIKSFKEIGEGDFFTGGVALSGILVYYVLRVDGSSQVYFFFCASVFISVIGITWVSNNWNSLHFRRKYVFAIACIIGMSSSLSLSGWRAADGYERVFMEAPAGDYREPAALDAMTFGEYEAMLWIRKNTSPDIIMAVDRHYHKENKVGAIPEPNDAYSRYYYYTAFAERKAFISSWAYLPRTQKMQSDIVRRLRANDALYSNQCLNRAEILRSNHISYVILSRFVHGDLQLEDPCLQEVFRNSDIIIYKFTDGGGRL